MDSLVGAGVPTVPSVSNGPTIYVASYVESTSFLTTTSTFTFSGHVETAVIASPVTATLVSLIPYLPSQSSVPQTHNSVILPLAAAVGGLVTIVFAVALCMFVRGRQRRRVVKIGRNQPEKKLRLDTAPLEALEAPAHTPSIVGSRTFSRLTYSAPYVLPQSPISLSTAAPSTVSMGQQYGTAPVEGRLM
ncbi:hypothetical protein DFH07DRAFT_956815 [Mycena maculata]|uniref:Transmembrane protein n=1 Tax=Mycena maculata TaxID=230809 RepID=A0AAD7JD12_9AGAR|nr:hypothetical protein DFH07DRAFT_956815 [Mycena maculata]